MPCIIGKTILKSKCILFYMTNVIPHPPLLPVTQLTQKSKQLKEFYFTFAIVQHTCTCTKNTILKLKSKKSIDNQL